MDEPFRHMITAIEQDQSSQISALSAGILAAAALGLSRDSRSFARKLGLAHALVLRECVSLAEEHGLIELDEREDRSQRLFYALSPQGLRLIDKVV